MAVEDPNNSDSNDSDCIAGIGGGNDSSSDDPFSFKKRAFSGRRASGPDGEDSSDDDDSVVQESARKPRKSRKKSCPGLEERLSKLQNKKRSKVRSADDLSDEESVIEIVGEKSAPAPAQEEIVSSDDEIELLEAPSRNSATYSGANADALKAFQEARDARRKLLSAREYHAEDIRVVVPQSPYFPPNPMEAALGYERIPGHGALGAMQPMLPRAFGAAIPPPILTGMSHSLYPSQAALMAGVMTGMPLRNSATATPSHLNRASLGKPIRLKLRVREFVNGKQTTTAKVDRVSIKDQEPLQRLVDKWLKKKGLSSESTTVELHFDEKLDLSKTPAQYELVDDDLIDAVSRTIVVPPINQTNRARKALGTQMKLTLRVQEQKNGKKVMQDVPHVLEIRYQEPLLVLRDEFLKKQELSLKSTNITMTFDGLAIEWSKTPKDLDMENEDIIDVFLKQR